MFARRMSNEEMFARKCLRAYGLYLGLAEYEKDPELKKILEELAVTSREQFGFWGRKSGVRGDMERVSSVEVWLLHIARVLFGLTRTAQFIVGRKKRRVAEYVRYCGSCGDAQDAQVVSVFTSRLNAIIERIQTQSPLSRQE